MKFSYVLPDPSSSGSWNVFLGDLACVKSAGYDAVELQIADPAGLDEERLRLALATTGTTLCAFQTGSTYLTRGNCLATADEAIRRRTIDLLLSFVEFAARFGAVIVFGSLQGRLVNEPDRDTGSQRIREALRTIGQRATERNVTLAFEPVNHGEVGFHNTIAEAAQVVRGLNLPGVRLMVDTFHMNIEEQDLLTPLPGIADLLAHIHLSETNRDVLGEGRWPTAAFLEELERIGYHGYCSVGVYNTRRPRRQCIEHCMVKLHHALSKTTMRRTP